MGRNGAGKTTLFKTLTGQIHPDEGEIMIAPGKKLGLISQIPRYPFGYTTEMVLRTAFSELVALQRKMERLAVMMAEEHTDDILREYDALSVRFQAGGGYEMDVEVE